MKRMLSVVIVIAAFAGLAGCAPEVGSERWCKKLDEKPKGEWTANEISGYTQHCIFRKKN